MNYHMIERRELPTISYKICHGCYDLFMLFVSGTFKVHNDIPLAGAAAPLQLHRYNEARALVVERD